MAKELDSIIKIDNEDYSITAEKAKKVANKLKITVNGEEHSFDGSESVTLNLNQLGQNQNASAFSKIAVAGQSDVSADTSEDTLTLIAGDNITITTNATNDSITIASTGGNSLDTDTNQTIKVDGTTFGVNDVVELAGSGNISITADATNKKITISSESINAETTLTIVNKTQTDTADTVYAVTDLTEDPNDQNGHYVTPTYSAVPTKKYVDDKVGDLISHGTEDPGADTASQYYFKYI